jgi:uncharacterized repeat protein (TIGR03803 family)
MRSLGNVIFDKSRLTTPLRWRLAWWAFALRFAALLGLATGTCQPAKAQTFTVLYSFAGYPTDGAGPGAGLLMDASGNLYGTTVHGGNVNVTDCGNSGYVGCGTAFKLDTNGKETVLHNFAGADGANPTASVVMDARGDLYGTTEFGGRLQDCTGNGSAGCGVVFKLSGKKETVLYRFCSVGNCEDGAEPLAGLVMDRKGTLYGTAYLGGSPGYGVVFKLAGTKETVLHAFTGFPDGSYPIGGLVIDGNGNLYGTASEGGRRNLNCDGCGTVFKLAGRKMTVLHAFKGTPDGEAPAAALSMDPSGNLYGTTAAGGNNYSLGTVFEVSAEGKEHVLYRFGPPLDHAGFYPQSRVVRDAKGNLYGATEEGGKFGAGIVFEVGNDGKEKVLHNFCAAKNCPDGVSPNGDLIMDAMGNLYGTTFGGGANHSGTIFKITLHSPNAP